MARAPNPCRLEGKAFVLANPGLSWPDIVAQCPKPFGHATPTRRDWLEGAHTARAAAKRKATA